ncbi:tpr repeat-containing protein : Putative uncharacterized protein OS=uncultured myxobacterium HF0200_08J13 PE=4 SV=1 [Gemmata massiliana]|uniref:Doubled CXXCH motif domain-containing protein n=1 Tax=Gemmata massiliana TaxID=1210884 RepID=A0A6P2CVF9_9BACT|nr:HEAT repeat domain-containing protein [Gemmata massiliana]VTR92961.1 tpr repeat-containing protein : Putative uncharacterized protein OS=uncultured myxobacterium HF0200_08J13 PE=4 SV=1 [Gemmata massiliana]
MSEQPPPPRSPAPRRFLAVLVALVGVVFALVASQLLRPTEEPPKEPGPGAARESEPRLPPHLKLATGRHLTVWWDGPPDLLRLRTVAGTTSNIRHTDYTGPDTCARCHPGTHADWSAHPHRWMNVPAGAGTVRGDFSPQAAISYRGGTGTFEARDGKHFMRLVRDGATRVYEVTQTIGSRFYQYYVGKQTEGPEPRTHHFYHKDHVLPFGYWLAKKEWVPVVHIGPEKADDDRPDPYHPPDRGQHYAEYAASCNYCHTTFALGDLMARRPHQVGEHAPVPLHWSVGGYLEQSRPADFKAALGAMRDSAKGAPVQSPISSWDSAHYAASFGVSCEACHLGCKEHVASDGKTPPRFFPEDPLLLVEARSAPDPGRTHDNLNWSCARCHTGGRPAFAGGMSTWNSVEYSDAAKGSCYSQLRCIDCHPPHKALGAVWTPPPEKDDAVCLKCHTKFGAPAARREHTHHAPGSSGDRCLNCHMPRINEGLNDVVRTHMIYSPTRPDMIHANHPNACNLCHTDKPIDWTLKGLKDWYGKTYDESAIAQKYPKRTEPAALGWLASGEESVRLVAADALVRAKDRAALPQLLSALDDPFLLNRQFAAKGLEEMLGARFTDTGYRFYMTSAERRKPLSDLREKYLPPKGK